MNGDLLATTSTGFRQIDDIPKVIGVVALNDMNSRRMSFPQIDGSGAVELDDIYFRRTS